MNLTKDLNTIADKYPNTGFGAEMAEIAGLCRVAAKEIESLEGKLAERDREIERLREVQRWIRVEEKTPDYNDHSYHPIAHNCFVRDIHNNYAYAIYYAPATDKSDPWITTDEDVDTILITHWMPLPELPKGE